MVQLIIGERGKGKTRKRRFRPCFPQSQTEPAILYRHVVPFNYIISHFSYIVWFP